MCGDRPIKYNQPVKKSLAFFLTLALGLSGGGVFLLSPEEEPVVAAETTSYVDLATGVTSLSANSFYMIGAYSLENTTPYVYLLSNHGGTLSADKIPCQASDAASHPYGISESDFRSCIVGDVTYSGLYAPFMAYDQGNSTFSFSFTTSFGNFGVDTTNQKLIVSTDANNALTPTLSEVSSHTEISITGLQAVIGNESGSYSYAASGSFGSGIVTSFLLYSLPIASGSVYEKESAVGFGAGLKAGHFDSTNAKTTYQSLHPNQRALYATSSSESNLACAAVSKIISDSWNVSTTGFYDLVGSLDFHAADPSGISVDYVNDILTGLNGEESYLVSYGSTSVHLYPNSNGTCDLLGNSDNSNYDFAGSTLAIKTYGTTTTESLNAFSLAIAERVAAPASANVSLANPSITPTGTVQGLYNDEILLTAETNVLYCCVDSTTVVLSSTCYTETWTSTPDFTNLTAETAYSVYKRISSTTAPDSLPYANADGLAIGTSFTTLSALEGLRRHALVAVYSYYQETLKSSSNNNDNQMLAGMLGTLDTKINAATTTDAIGQYLTEYSISAFSYAQKQDELIADFRTTVALVASDSDLTNAASTTTIEDIQHLSYFNNDDITSCDSEIALVKWTITGYRYRENLERSLVAYFNTTILPQLASLSSTSADAVWSTLSSDLTTLAAVTGTDLATMKSAADTAFATAKSDLDSRVASLLGGKS